MTATLPRPIKRTPAKIRPSAQPVPAVAAPLPANNHVYLLIGRLCDKLWAAGVTNPISYVEQISYLFFLKMLDETEIENERDAKLSKRPYKPIFSGDKEEFRWSSFSQITDTKRLYNFVRNDVFDFIRTLRGREEIRRLFEEAQLQIPDGSTLRDCIDLFREFNFLDLDTDAKGNLYENLLRRVGTQAQAGQFLTPRHLIRAIVKMVDPQIGQTVCDPSFGTGGFLIAAYDHIKVNNSDPKNIVEKINGNGQLVKRGYGDRLSDKQWEFLRYHTFYGFDVDPHIVRLGMMNLILHGLEDSKILRRDSIAGQVGELDEKQFDIILANPPFAGSMNTDRVRESLPVISTKTEVLFLGLMIQALSDGGRCGVIVPEGLLFGTSKSHVEVRRYLLEKCNLQAVVSFPGGVFKPYSSVKTSALIFTKGKPTKKVWFYEIMADGFSLDDNRRPTPDKNDIPDLIAKWTKSEISEKSWLATIEQIRAAGFTLTAGRYKPVIAESVQHDAPKDILGEVLEMESEIIRRGNALFGHIGRKK
ncbi:MAG TPA: N-6 DNA methylase [Candidatus Sulfotelmatobacter sp.]|jgi:type I restriction enzyme M protein|nr:N-6 DNA methylase [Candidatus Sulfotelmatobacter sp.]